MRSRPEYVHALAHVLSATLRRHPRARGVVRWLLRRYAVMLLSLYVVTLAQLTRANACVVQVNVYDMAENTTAPTYEVAGTDMLLNTGYC